MFAAGLRRLLPPRTLRRALGVTPLVLLLVACTSSAPPPASTPKPASAPTSASRPTASPGAAASPKPVFSPAAAPDLQIVDATLADAEPWIMLRLTGGEPQIVSGRRPEDGDQSVAIPGNAIAQPDNTLTLHVGEGESSDREVFVGAGSDAVALAAKPGARVRLLDATGAVKVETTVPRF